MNTYNNSQSSLTQKGDGLSSKIRRILIFGLQVSLVIALLVVWLSSESIRNSKNLWVLFFYSFPSEFLIAVVPHEPVLLYFGKFYPPLTVALVAIIGTLITEAINYSVFKFISDTNPFKKIRHKKTINKIVELFNKSPFIALLIAGLTPIPFYPFRFLVVVAHYPLIKYILALFLSRTPRFFLLAFIGYKMKIPDYFLVILFIGIIISINIPIVRNLLKKRQRNKTNVS